LTIHDIVAAVYLDRRVNEFLQKQEPADLRQDLLHHCVMEIYRINDKYPGKIEELHSKDLMFAFFVGMVRNQLHSKKSTFFTRFRRMFVEIDNCHIFLSESENYDQRQKALYETLALTRGFDFAKAAMSELDKMAENHVRDENIKDRPKFIAPTLF
jgi:tyrosine-protein phosphatase YwqE